MKLWIFCGLLLASAVSFCEPPSEDYKLIWADEFNKDGGPDSTKWIPEHTGFLRNQEEQWYTDSRENAYVKDGCLHLVALKTDMPNPWYKEGSKNWKNNRKRIKYTSGAILTKGRFEFKYGYVEMRAKLPPGQGIWAAFWTIGTDLRKGDWPWQGEIDIFEYMGRNGGKSWLQSVIHWKLAGMYQQKNHRLVNIDHSKDFHLYAMEWDKDNLSFFVDGEKHLTYPIEQCQQGDFNPFRAPHFLLVDLALGGTLGGKVDPNIFPADFQIDYIRVYQKK